MIVEKVKSPLYPIILIILLIFSYIILRDYFLKYVKANKKVLNNRLKIIMLVNGIIGIFFMFNVTIKLANSSKYDANIINLLFSTDYCQNYEFRIASIILFILAILLFVFIIKKKIYKIFPIFILLGILANIMIYIDVLNYNWSKIVEKSLNISFGVIHIIICIIIYIFYLIQEKKAKDYRFL